MMLRKRGRILGLVLFLSILICSVAATVLPTRSVQAATNPDFASYASTSIQVLQGWYNSSNGQFNTTGWWNSANALGAVIDYSRLSGDTSYTGDIATTFNANSGGSFLNNYYDDEGWWGLTWVNAYDYTGNNAYLDMAKTIFNDMTTGWDSTCNGGIWWSKDRNYKNAIANELFLSLAARLHERTPNDGGSGSFLDWANRDWSWFSGSGMINSSNLINDGLTSSCQNNGDTTWTYNQGVILGGLTDMYKITANTSYLSQAEAIANAATGTLVDGNGILKEPCEPSCGGDGSQFKGIFTRNLAYLYNVDHQQSYQNFITNNASSIWQNDRNGSNQLGLMWYGSFDSADASRQSSAQDALNAAIAFSNQSSSPSNVALSKSATANGSCNSSETPDKAVDGSATNDSKWCSGATNGQYWLQIDLGASYTVTSFTLMHAGAGGENAVWNTQAWNIQVSSDASNWSTVVTVANNTADITTHPIAPTTARYLKLNVTTPQTDPNSVAARIYEFQAYGFSSSSSGNLALNKSATANGSCSSSEAADKAVDGNTTYDSKWCSGATNGQYWLKIDLGSSMTVGRFVIYHAGAGGENSQWDTRDFTIQTSTDNANWTTVATVTGNTSDITTNTISSRQAQYVLLNITNPQSNNQFVAARIYELEVFNS